MKNILYILIISTLLTCYYSLNAQMANKEPVWVRIGDAKRSIARNESSKALELLNKVIVDYPDSADAYYLLGNVYEKEAGNVASLGGATAYRVAISQYKNAIKYAKNFSVPAYELDCYFRLLNIYDRLVDNVSYTETEASIISLANSTYDIEEKGRVYFRLAENYYKRSHDIASLEYYLMSYQAGYRKKLSLFRMSLIYRKMRNYVKEKEMLILASKYEFEFEEPSNYDVEKALFIRLQELQNVVIPKKLN